MSFFEAEAIVFDKGVVEESQIFLKSVCNTNHKSLKPTLDPKSLVSFSEKLFFSNVASMPCCEGKPGLFI